MKTKKVVGRSPMQMTIVAFVLLFVAITATILVMYFKWFASEELGAPAAVNVVGEEKVEVVEVVNKEESLVLPELTDWNTLENKENLVPGFMYDGAKNIVYLFMKDLDGKEYLVWQKELAGGVKSSGDYKWLDDSIFLFIDDYSFLYTDQFGLYIYNLNTEKELKINYKDLGENVLGVLNESEKNLEDLLYLFARTENHLYLIANSLVAIDLNTGEAYMNSFLLKSPPGELDSSRLYFPDIDFYFQTGDEVVFGMDTSGYWECYPNDSDLSGCDCGNWWTSYFIFNERTKESKYKKVDTTACQPRKEFGDDFDIGKYEAIFSPRDSRKVDGGIKSDNRIKILAVNPIYYNTNYGTKENYFSLCKGSENVSIMGEYNTDALTGEMLPLTIPKSEILWGEKLLGDLKFEW